MNDVLNLLTYKYLSGCYNPSRLSIALFVEYWTLM